MEKLDHTILNKKTIYVDVNQKVNFSKKGRKIEYDLIECDLGLREKAKLLKMRNPSLEDVWHYEFVKPNCRTVMDAMEFRNGKREIPVYLS